MSNFRELFSLSQKDLQSTALYLENEPISYRELLKKIEEKAFFFQNLGIKPLERVAFLPDLSYSSIVTFFALLQIGASLCLLNARLAKEQISSYVARARAHFLSQENLLFFQGETSSFTTQEILLFTSGSSNAAKLVSLTPLHFLANSVGASPFLRLTSESCWLLSVPLFHVSGLSILFRCFSHKCSIALTKTPLEGNRLATHISFVPTQLLRMLEKKRSYPSLECLLVGGAALSATLIKQSIAQNIPLYITYGMTEMASQITMTRKADSLFPLHVGKPLPGREVQIAEDGEILVKGECLFRGYDTLNGLERPLLHGWFPTRDLGSWDRDGNLVYKGRKDRLFISGGENIYPEMIEEALCLIEGVLHSVVVSVQDAEYGQRAVAFLEMKGPLLSKEAFYEKLTPLIPRFSFPVAFLPLPEELKEKGLKIKPSDLQKYYVAINS